MYMREGARKVLPRTGIALLVGATIAWGGYKSGDTVVCETTDPSNVQIGACSQQVGQAMTGSNASAGKEHQANEDILLGALGATVTFAFMSFMARDLEFRATEGNVYD
jgi:hypothetical protein